MARFKNHDRLQLWRSAARNRLRASGVMRAAQDLGIRDRPTEPVAIAQAARGGAVQELINHALMPPWCKPPALGDLPLTVITARAQNRGIREPVWQEMQTELVALSTRSTQVFAENAGHHINRDDPEFLVWVLRDVSTELRG